MKLLPKSNDKSVSEDVLLKILHHLCSKSLARFVCVCKHWRKCIADPSMVYSCRSQRWSPHPYMVGFFCQSRYTCHEQIRFFFSSKESSEVIDVSLDKSFNFLGRGARIVASSNGFILVSQDLRNQVYYVYNPATRQCCSVTATQEHKFAAIGFHCKVDDPEKDVISFTIVVYEIWFCFRSSVTIESFSSETNLWTTINLRIDVPLRFSVCTWTVFASAGVIDGVFCWRFYAHSHIILYDSVGRRFWAMQLSEEMYRFDDCALGVSGGVLYNALYHEEKISLWYLEGNIRSQDAVWVRKYVASISKALLTCPEPLGYVGTSIRMLSIDTHSVNPHIFYLLVGDKVISYDSEKNIAEFLYVIRGFQSTTEFFSYEWHQWPRLL